MGCGFHNGNCSDRCGFAQFPTHMNTHTHTSKLFNYLRAFETLTSLARLWNQLLHCSEKYWLVLHLEISSAVSLKSTWMKYTPKSTSFQQLLLNYNKISQNLLLRLERNGKRNPSFPRLWTSSIPSVNHSFLVVHAHSTSTWPKQEASEFKPAWAT